MCGMVIQSSARYGIVDEMNVRDSHVHNYPPRWNGAPSQNLLVIRSRSRDVLPKINSNGTRGQCALVCGRLAEFVLAFRENMSQMEGLLEVPAWWGRE